MTDKKMLLRLEPDMAERLQRVADWKGINPAALSRSAVYDAIREAEVEMAREEARLERARRGTAPGIDQEEPVSA